MKAGDCHETDSYSGKNFILFSGGNTGVLYPRVLMGNKYGEAIPVLNQRLVPIYKVAR